MFHLQDYPTFHDMIDIYWEAMTITDKINYPKWEKRYRDKRSLFETIIEEIREIVRITNSELKGKKYRASVDSEEYDKQYLPLIQEGEYWVLEKIYIDDCKLKTKPIK